MRGFDDTDADEKLICNEFGCGMLDGATRLVRIELCHVSLSATELYCSGWRHHSPLGKTRQTRTLMRW